MNLIDDLQNQSIGFRSLCDGVIDTVSASGELIFNIFSALAQFERRLFQERTRAGLAAARARGRCGGRPPIPADSPKVQLAWPFFNDRTIRIGDISETLNVSRATFYRYVKMARAHLSQQRKDGICRDIRNDSFADNDRVYQLPVIR